MATVEIKNIGPIDHLAIPVPEDGGVVVLRGRQGDGKSTAIRAVAAVGGRADKGLSVRDGQKSGTVEFGGVKLSVSRSRQTKSGELEVDSIEGRFDIGRLVDPGIADEERSDAARIKQLLALTGAKADAAPYYELARKKGYVIDFEDDTDDPIELYRNAKKAFERDALSAEKLAATLPDSKPSMPADAPPVSECQSAQEAAVIRLARLQADREAADKQQAAHAKAMARMAELAAGDTFDSADSLAGRVKSHEAELVGLTKQLSDLQEKIKAEREALRVTVQELESAVRHEKAMADAKTLVSSLADAATGPSDETVDAAKQAVEDARAATQAAILADKAHGEYQEICAQVDKRRKLEERATIYRELAKSCESVLAESLPESELRVDGPRLVTSTDRSPCEPYGDLSHGERAIIAIGIVSRYLPPHGIATISQEIWSGISPANQERINAEAKARGIVIVTADVEDAPLSAEVM